ncbi:Heat shock protein 70 [Psychromonas ingrahamii 37]|uniref:Heat shock protein 70 n=1 Tax=Psychromonas ingrahamii (strain DSM 17664 / CCUG 51855 / 37) TaxID=357804 RepID=A1SY38_PSYIN|nr:Hsp70 family protein [Psychromonas ingrahamii]ABM04403.1 Heat shock protein 70 [Psychromonas ingrahamii 37]
MNELTITKLFPSCKQKEFSESLKERTYVGIDFGTSTTVVSIAYLSKELGIIESQAIDLNQKLFDGAIHRSYKIPTMLAYVNNQLLVGEGANKLKLKLKKDKNFWHSFKMELGEDIGCKYPQSELNNEKFKLLNPKDASKLFFRYLKVQIEKYVNLNHLSREIEYTVSIPASFEANQRKDLIESLHENGMMLDKPSLIDEPNAAFLSYISDNTLKSNIHISEDIPTNILIFDFGAGTCDISILEIGYNFKGFYSKNLSISRFDELGGRNIDKLIAIDILFPQFIKQNNVEESFFKMKVINKIIIPRLETVAELLKIQACKELSLMNWSSKNNEVMNLTDTVQVHHEVSFKTKHGTFSLSIPTLTFAEFIKITDSFTSKNKLAEKRLNDEEKFTSIYTPVNSSLLKADLDAEDIDYLLFVGGSCKNPIIRDSLQHYFPETEMLLPHDLQAHVSSGAAIQSLIYNGYGRNIVEPITSEPIITIIKDGSEEVGEVLIPSGAEIPTAEITISGLFPSNKVQEQIEIPICVGNKNKLVHNIMIKNVDNKPFSLDSEVTLTIKINEDKLIMVRAEVDGLTIDAEPLNPFSNSDMSFKDKQRFKAESEYNKECARNFGVETKDALVKLYKRYDELGLSLKAAESLEQLYDKFGYSSLNRVALHYSDAGLRDKAIYLYQKAYEENKAPHLAFNLACQYHYNDNKKYEHWIEQCLECDSNYSLGIFSKGKVLISNGEIEKGKLLIKRAFDKWKDEYENNYLSVHISWLSSAAAKLGEYDFVEEIKGREDEDLNLEQFFDANNLLTTHSINTVKGY